MINPLFLKGRFLFVVDDCPFCEIWKSFVEDLNMDIDISKGIEIIDCTNFHDFGVVDDQRILKFMPYINGIYPVLFFEGRRKDGTNSRAEAEAWLRAKLHKEFILEQHNPYLFQKDCEFIMSGKFKNKLICESY